MKIKTFGYFSREALTSLRRNSWMVLASVGTVAVSLIIVGMSLITVINTNYLAARLESNVEIIAYCKGDVNEGDARALKGRIDAIAGVAKAQFVSKDQALQEFRKELGDQQNMIDALGSDNPLPHLYRITAISPQDVDGVANKVRAIPQIDTVDYGKAVVEKLFAITKWIRWIGLAVMILLGLAAIFLIATTIRLTVFARRREIQIMKILGATDWFIRWPFLIEGMTLGFVGAVISVLVVDVSYTAFTNYLNKDLNFSLLGLQTDVNFLLMLGAILVVSGTLIGAAGSGISMRKFLKV